MDLTARGTALGAVTVTAHLLRTLTDRGVLSPDEISILLNEAELATLLPTIEISEAAGSAIKDMRKIFDAR